MKKILILLIILMNIITVDANSKIPAYKIIGNSLNEEDIKEQYTVKNNLLTDFEQWSKGVNNHHQVLQDHTSNYNATFKDGIYTIILGQGRGKALEGTIQVNYCSSVKQVEKKSWFLSLFDF